MDKEDRKLLNEWNSICRSVKRGLRKLGHDIPLVNYEAETVICQKSNEKYIRTGEMIAWGRESKYQEQKTGMIVAIIPKGESAMKCVPKNIKKSKAQFQDISKIDRVLIAVSDGPEDNQMHYLCPSYGVVKASVRRVEEC